MEFSEGSSDYQEEEDSDISSGSSSSAYSHEDGHIGTSSGSEADSFSSDSSYEAKVFDATPLKPRDKKPTVRTAKSRAPAKKVKSMPKKGAAKGGKKKGGKKGKKGGKKGKKGASKKLSKQLSKQLTSIGKVVKAIKKGKK